MANRESKLLEVFDAEPGQEIKINVMFDERFCMIAKSNLLWPSSDAVGHSYCSVPTGRRALRAPLPN